MKYNKKAFLKKSKGFTLIETTIYIFLTTIILLEGISLFTLMYKYYLEARNISIKYNDLQNFYINLDKITSEGNIDEITVNNNSISFSKSTNKNKLSKTIKSNEGDIFVKYTKGNTTGTINTILIGIDNLSIQKKGNLIYLIIKDKDGKEFIRCL